MNGKRQKIQPGLALQPRDWGEPSVGGSQGVEPSMAKSTLESPAPTDRMSPSTLNPVEPPWYGPVCPVVWEGRHREVPPYPDPMAEPVRRRRCQVLLPCTPETVDARADSFIGASQSSDSREVNADRHVDANRSAAGDNLWPFRWARTTRLESGFPASGRVTRRMPS